MATKKTAAQKAAEAFAKAQGQQGSQAALSLAKAQGPAGPAKGVDRIPPVGAPVGPAVLPETPDPYLENAKLTAGRNIGLSDADSAWQRGQLQRSSGFDASGNLITSGADFNPFSQAMILQDEYKHSQAGTSNSYAAMGQYNSGAYGRAQAHNDTGYAQGYDALKTGTLTGYHGIDSGQLTTYANNSLGVSDEAFNALRRRIYGS